jgi:beta-glucosidase
MSKDRLAVDESIESRVEALVARMTLEEKINQMSVRMGAGDDPATAARLNTEAQKDAIAKSPNRIPLLLTRESSHGLNTAGVTSFPACITMGSTWDEELNDRIGRAIAVEARAQGVHQGLSPVLDIARDPRWGRQEETYGEDPHLTSRLGVAFIKGMQGDRLRDGIIACPKHLVGYGASEGGKDNDPISITYRDLHETYLPPFEAAFTEADAQSVMICYGAVNGIPCTSDKAIVTDLLAKWNFTGHVLDDCPGIAGLLGHHAAHDIKEAIALSINAGIDRQFYDFIGEVPNQIAGQEKFEKILLELVREGKVPQSRIDAAARRVLRHKLMLGLFEDAMVDPDHAARVGNCDEHRALARETAAKAIVLLKNENDLLPLDATKLRTIAVIGPNAAEGQLGDYSGRPAHIVSPLEGIKALVGNRIEVLHAEGCEILSPALVGARFSVRITGNLKVDTDAEYTLRLETNDGVRLFLDGEAVIDDWTTGRIRPREAKLHLTRGDHALKLEYFRGTKFMNPDPTIEMRNRNTLRLSWAASHLPMRVIPTDNLTYRGALGTQQHGSGEGLMMEPFLGPNFDRALPEQNRVIREIDFDWGDRSPILATTAESQELESIAQAVEIAKRADVALLFVGETSVRGPQQVCGEHFDRANIELTGSQQQLIDAVLATGTPTVAVLVCGRALAIPKIAERVPAIVQAWYPGQEGGHAIADVLFGQVNPSGKLPVSMPYSAGHLPVHFGRRPRMGWYIDAKSDPLYPFGFGLSYTTFEYSNLRVTPERGGASTTFVVEAELKNTGSRAGDEIVQLYVKDAVCTFVTPIKRLVGFRRVSLQPGERKSVRFELTQTELALLDRDFEPRVEAGEFKVQLGGDAAGGPTVSLWVEG